MIFSKDYCPFCKDAQNLLMSNGIEYKIVEMDLAPDGKEMHDTLKMMSKHNTVPLIYISQHKVGGYDDLLKLYENGTLMDKVNEKKHKALKTFGIPKEYANDPGLYVAMKESAGQNSQAKAT